MPTQQSTCLKFECPNFKCCLSMDHNFIALLFGIYNDVSLQWWCCGASTRSSLFRGKPVPFLQTAFICQTQLCQKSAETSQNFQVALEWSIISGHVPSYSSRPLCSFCPRSSAFPSVISVLQPLLSCLLCRVRSCQLLPLSPSPCTNITETRGLMMIIVKCCCSISWLWVGRVR